MNYNMQLTPDEIEILNGSKGEAMAKVMKTLVMYGDAFGAENRHWCVADHPLSAHRSRRPEADQYYAGQKHLR